MCVRGEGRGGTGPAGRRWRLPALVAAIVPLVVAGWVLTDAGDLPREAGPVAHEPPASQDVEAGALDGAPGLGTREPAARDGGDSRELLAPTLHVTVLDAQERPVEHAEVVLFPTPVLLAQQRAESGVSVRTNAIGEASVTLDSWTTYVLDVRKDGFASVRREVAPGDSVTVVLERAAGLELFCYDSRTREPVEGVTLRVAGTDGARETRSGPDGTARLVDLAEGRYAVEVSAQGYLDHTLYRVEASAGAPAVDVPMFRPLRIAGTVVDASTGQPLREGSVEAWGPLAAVETCAIDETGAVVFTGLPDERAASYRVLAPGYESALSRAASVLQDPTQPGAWTILVEARPIGRITGSVTAGGVPVPGAMVALGRYDVLRYLLDGTGRFDRLAAGKCTQTRTLADGSFSSNAPGGDRTRPIELFVLAEGYAPLLRELPPEPPTTPVEVSMTEGTRLTVHVRDERGAPLPRALVTLLLRNPTREGDVGAPLRLLDPPILTDAKGSAPVEHLSPGSWELQVTPHGAPYRAVFPFEAEGTGECVLTCTVNRAQLVTAVLLDARGASAGPGFLSWTDRPWEPIPVGDDGEFTVYCDDPHGGEMTWLGACSFDTQRLHVRPGMDRVTGLEPGFVPQRYERVTATLVDDATGERIPLGSYSTRGNSQVIAGGSFELDLALDSIGTIRFCGPGHPDRVFTFPELRARVVDGHVEIRM